MRYRKFSKCKILVGKILTNQHSFVKFVRLFHRQSFALYGIWPMPSCYKQKQYNLINNNIELIILTMAWFPVHQFPYTSPSWLLTQMTYCLHNYKDWHYFNLHSQNPSTQAMVMIDWKSKRHIGVSQNLYRHLKTAKLRVN